MGRPTGTAKPDVAAVREIWSALSSRTLERVDPFYPKAFHTLSQPGNIKMFTCGVLEASLQEEVDMDEDDDASLLFDGMVSPTGQRHPLSAMTGVPSSSPCISDSERLRLRESRDEDEDSAPSFMDMHSRGNTKQVCLLVHTYATDAVRDLRSTDMLGLLGALSLLESMLHVCLVTGVDMARVVSDPRRQMAEYRDRLNPDTFTHALLRLLETLLPKALPKNSVGFRAIITRTLAVLTLLLIQPCEAEGDAAAEDPFDVTPTPSAFLEILLDAYQRDNEGETEAISHHVTTLPLLRSVCSALLETIPGSHLELWIGVCMFLCSVPLSVMARVEMAYATVEPLVGALLTPFAGTLLPECVTLLHCLFNAYSRASRGETEGRERGKASSAAEETNRYIKAAGGSETPVSGGPMPTDDDVLDDEENTAVRYLCEAAAGVFGKWGMAVLHQLHDVHSSEHLEAPETFALVTLFLRVCPYLTEAQLHAEVPMPDWYGHTLIRSLPVSSLVCLCCCRMLIAHGRADRARGRALALASPSPSPGTSKWRRKKVSEYAIEREASSSSLGSVTPGSFTPTFHPFLDQCVTAILTNMAPFCSKAPVYVGERVISTLHAMFSLHMYRLEGLGGLEGLEGVSMHTTASASMDDAVTGLVSLLDVLCRCCLVSVPENHHSPICAGQTIETVETKDTSATSPGDKAAALTARLHGTVQYQALVSAANIVEGVLIDAAQSGGNVIGDFNKKVDAISVTWMYDAPKTDTVPVLTPSEGLMNLCMGLIGGVEV
ncbi:hypothetical protein KIPB_003272 [Kipferlia bialata]|uniref:Uncharacterized protein n=1 Tax=Kipferlia bialata TaxID=797122 RepID=A0A9K3GGJ9_9EUKA|nr:hypothetical protein KIPB_003272 [Kipferlia bialata]|eukprot:g3272.t1